MIPCLTTLCAGVLHARLLPARPVIPSDVVLPLPAPRRRPQGPRPHADRLTVSTTPNTFLTPHGRIIAASAVLAATVSTATTATAATMAIVVDRWLPCSSGRTADALLTLG